MSDGNEDDGNIDDSDDKVTRMKMRIGTPIF